MNKMTKSNTKITRQTKAKGNPELVETIHLAKKNKGWHRVAEILSYPRRKRPEMNLDEISIRAKGSMVLIPGKVLSQGELDKKIKVVAFNFSKTAKEKLEKAKIEYSNIITEIKKNPDAKGIEILE
jgi:large subunit ribosomal protein L18e